MEPKEDLCDDESLFQFKAAVDIGCDPKTLNARCNASIDVISFQIRVVCSAHYSFSYCSGT